jgi:hypothetical protein
MLLRSVAAISLAAARTSSSMARVVRMASSFVKHHASIIIHQEEFSALTLIFLGQTHEHG